MFPDKTPYQAPGPASLPAVPAQPVQQVGALPMGSAMPAVQTGAPMAAVGSNLEANVERLKLLMQQYGNNPFAMSAALQQLKGQYLREQYNIDPSVEKH